jgi:hypothetical protein
MRGIAGARLARGCGTGGGVGGYGKVKGNVMWAVIVGALSASLLGIASGPDANVATPAVKICAEGREASWRAPRPPAPGDWVRPEDSETQAAPASCRAPEPAAARERADRAQRRI